MVFPKTIQEKFEALKNMQLNGTPIVINNSQKDFFINCLKKAYVGYSYKPFDKYKGLILFERQEML